ncbi:MAG: protein phosphatase 2C domain-containing protein [Planctomycetaceae bacterium]|jgi:serine/threonine protein phosphatase PrpC|nr:protein phosphatase 2C domain-containing protein [Planctomycetaceae bacterium]
MLPTPSGIPADQLPFYYRLNELTQNNETIIILSILAFVIILVSIIATFLLTRWHYKSKTDMTEITRNEKKQTVRKIPSSAEMKKVESTRLDTDKDPITPFKAAELGTLEDVVEKVTPQPPVDTQESPKKEVGLAVTFQYRIQEKDDRPESYFTKQITARIDATNIPAGSVGVPYEFIVDFTPLVEDLIIIDPKPNEDFGNRGFAVTFEGNKMKITGTPRDSVDDPLRFCFKNENKKTKAGQDEYPYNTYPKPFIINPHPRDLWQNLPVTDYEGYQNKDFDAKGQTVDYVPAQKGFLSTTPAKSIEVIAASQRGRSHAHVGKPRDDCFHFEFDKETGWNFVAVADGAGSAKYSRKGSELACHTVISNLRANLSTEFNQTLQNRMAISLPRWKDHFENSMPPDNGDIETSELGNIFHNAIYAAYMAIHEESQKRNAETKDYHTTLLCAAFKYFENLKCWFIISYWVGDGGAAILRWNNKERVLVLGEPDGGEFAGQTKFLTMKEEINAEAIRKRLRFSFCESFESMLFVTDGITDPFFPSESAVADESRWLDFYERKLKNGCEEEPNGCPALFDETKSPQEKADALLQWLDFWSKGNHDDRTILVVKNKD